MKVAEADFKSIQTNASTSRASLVVNLQLESGEEKYIQLDKNLIFEEEEDGKYKAKTSTVKSMMVANMVIYDKSTMFFEKDADVLKSLEVALQSNKKIAVLKSGGVAYFGIPPSGIEMSLSGVVQDKDGGRDISTSEKHKKENLKAYETPSDVYDILLSAQQTLFFDHVANRITKGYAKNVYKEYSREHKNTTYSPDVFQMELSSIILEAINGKEIENSLNDSQHTKTIRKALLGMSEQQPIVKEFVEKMSKISNEMFPLKSFYEDKELREMVKEMSGFDDKKISFPVMDLQAGSGAGILKGFDNAGYEDNILIGTEIRADIEQEDQRYKVLTGKNSVTYSSAIESVVTNKTLSRAVESLQIYLNPPYTSEDYVTKKTFEVLDCDSLVYGIFPTKNSKLLSNEIDGLIIEIPREVTGYTDPKTPDNFLMVFGAIHKTKQEGGSSLMGGTIITRPTNKTLKFEKKEEESLEDAQKRLSFFISNNISQMGFLKTKIRTQYNYYVDGTAERKNIIGNKLSEKIASFDVFLDSIELRREALEKAWKGIYQQFTPVDIAKTQKVFPDTRYYSSDGKPQNYYFREIIGNVSLLNDYQQKSPSLFKIVQDVAESLNVKIPISIEKQDVFTLTERNMPSEKNLVTNMELGLMKSKYYPSLIGVSQEEDKKELVSIFSHISAKHYSGEIFEAGINTLEQMLEHADKMVLKNEQILIPNEGVIQNRECYVLQDSYEKDIGKLNMSLTDFYDELQNRGRFNIEDYVEEVKPSNELKSKLVKNFIEYTENIARTIEQEKDLRKLTIIQDAFSERQKLTKRYNNFLESSKDLDKDSSEFMELKDDYNKDYRNILLGFIVKHKLSDYLEDKIIFPSMNKILSGIVKKEEFNHLKNKDKNEIKKIIDDRFSGREIIFFEERVSEYEYLKNKLEDFGIKGGDFENVFYDIYDSITPMYVAKKAASNSYVKLGGMFLIDYTAMKIRSLRGENPADIFDKRFEKMFLETFELKPHQYKEAINTAALDKKLSMLLWEMRVGKTLTFAASLFMVGLAKSEDMSLFVETANLQDISSQVFEFMPQMFFQMRAFHTEPKKIDLSDNIVYERLLTEKFYPNIVSILNKRDSDLVTGGGTTLNSLKVDYNAKMENLLALLEEREDASEDESIDFNAIREQYQDSPLLSILDICDE